MSPDLFGFDGTPPDPAPDWMGNARHALSIVRANFNMDIAYLSRIDADCVALELLESGSSAINLREGDRIDLRDSYTPFILAGQLPSVVEDTARQPIARSLAITRNAPIGAYIGAPVKLNDGRVFGLFGCASAAPVRQLTRRDLRILSLFAEMVAQDIDKEMSDQSAIERRRARLRQIIDEQRFAFVHQVIWDVGRSVPVGAECLARIALVPRRSPDQWFGEAASLGLGAPFEMAAINAALTTLAELPAPLYLSVNASPHAVLDSGFEALFETVPLERVVLEITEHETIENYQLIERALRPLRQRGLRLAVDDAGAGYASLYHILELHPDIIKLDAGIIHRTDTDDARKALIGALVTYGRDMGVEIIAEGVETAAQKEVLQTLGVRLMQGYALTSPALLSNSGAFLT